MKYPKINTLFQRDDKNKIIIDKYSEPEFNYLKNLKWECTEKIDGTNIRIEIIRYANRDYYYTFKGRTDNAIIPLHLLAKLIDTFTDSKISKLFDGKDPQENIEITIFGEGYGYKIQKGSNYIPKDVDFILFDIKINDYWLTRESLENIAQLFNIKIVPIIGYYTIPEAIEIVKEGFKSTIAYNKDYDAEGLILKTTCGLLSRNGNRIITKLKTEDFR